ncbi:MAG TPA: TIM-barrel domain-containing protein [Bryobacteraceae bacterium]|nr:TIM-barrel domain-containing protein [Bryobacteraceae bacterium]
MVVTKPWNRSLLVAALLCAAPVPPALAVDIETMQPIGAVASFERTDRGILIHCADHSQVQVEFLAPDLVRVRAAFQKPLAASDRSLAIAKTDWPKLQWTLREDTAALTLMTNAAEIQVHRSPLLISLIDPKTHQVMNADYRPMLFDPGSPAIATMKKFGFDEHFYGLGEKAARLDKRRSRFTMWNTDAYGYSLGSDPLYQSIPFYIGLEEGSAYGLFYDNTYRCSIDLGAGAEDAVAFTADGGPMTYYLFAGPSMQTIVERYTELTGRIPMPPRWALGHQTSRYSYYPDSEVTKIAETYRAHDLPLDVIHLDIDYMSGYRVFTFDPERFPNPKQLTSSLQRIGVKIVTIVDPGVKFQPSQEQQEATSNPALAPQNKSYYVYNQLNQADYFLKRKNGEPYVGKVWPGESLFVDYTKPAAAKWWGQMFRTYLDNGIAGIWCDMNEPSDFIDQTGEKQMDVMFSDGTPFVGGRNSFGTYELKATYEGLTALRPDERPYLITRAGSPGIQRYSTVWTGDNTASWDSFALSIPMFQTLGLSGESFIGADVGGFIGRTNPELLTRWYQVGFLTPFFRNHTQKGGYDHEPWRFGPYYEDIIRKYIKLRYRLIPFLYSLVEQAHRTGLPVFRPLILNYQNDPNVFGIDDEFMLGADLLAAPILKPDQDSRFVYLPKGIWYDFWTKKQIQGGRQIKVDAPLDTVPLFVRAGAVLPLGPEMSWSTEKPVDPLTFLVYPDENGAAAGSIYEDDGVSRSYESGAFRRTAIHVERGANGFGVSLDKPDGSYIVPARSIVVEIEAESAKSSRLTDDGQAHRIIIQ